MRKVEMRKVEIRPMRQQQPEDGWRTEEEMEERREGGREEDRGRKSAG